MARTVTNNQLTPGSVFFVRGLVSFSRISRQTTDEERAKDNSRRMHKVDKNYTTITLYNAQVMAKNAQTPTLEERYGYESCYTSSSNAADHPGLNFSGMNKSQFLPKVGVLEQGKDPNNNPAYKEIQLEGELAKGTDVTLVMRVFAGQGNNGVSLDTVLINQTDFQYYGNNANVKTALADYGITFDVMPPSEKKAVPVAEATPVANVGAAIQNGQGAVPQATGNVFSSFGAAAQPNLANTGAAANVTPAANAAVAAVGAVPGAIPGFNPFASNMQNAQADPNAANAQNQNVQFGVGPNRTY